LFINYVSLMLNSLVGAHLVWFTVIAETLKLGLSYINLDFFVALTFLKYSPTKREVT